MKTTDFALDMLSRGFHLIPLKPYSNPRGLTPTELDKSVKQALKGGWQHSSSPSEEEVANWDGYNYGILTRGNDLAVVDGDSPESCKWVHNNLPPTPLMVKTRRGYHFYYRVAKGDTMPDTSSKDESLKFEFKTAGYVVGPGSMRIDGLGNAYIGYQLIEQIPGVGYSDLPYLAREDLNILDGAMLNTSQDAIEIVSTSPFRFVVKRAEQTNDHCFPPVNGQRYEACRDILRLAIRHDQLSYGEVLARLEGWERRTTHSGASNGMRDWKYQLDWYWNKNKEFVSSPTYGKKEPVEPEAQSIIPKEAMKAWELPELCQTIPGALQVYVDHYMETAQVPHNDMAILAALGLGSTVASRRYSTLTGAYSSLYLCNVAGTGCGKNHGVVLTKRVLKEANCEHLIGPNGYRSLGGLMSTLKDKPNHIAPMDEFGDMIAALKRRQNQVIVELWAEIRTVYSSNGDHYNPSAYSREGKAGKAVDKYSSIIKPGVTILGLTTLNQLMAALSSAEVENGTLNRFLININEAPREKPSMGQLLNASIKPPGELIEWVTGVGQALEETTTVVEDSSGNKETTERTRATTEVANPIIVHYDDAAKTLIDEWPDLNPTNDLFARFNENAHRIMVVLAVSCNPDEPVITTKLVRWAYTYLEHLYMRFDSVFGSSHANSEWEEKLNFALKLFSTLGSDARGKPEGAEFGMSKSRWSKKMRRYPRREQEEILAQLLENGFVLFGKEPGKSAKARFYDSTKVSKEFRNDETFPAFDSGGQENLQKLQAVK